VEIAIAFGSLGLGLVGLIAFLILRLVKTTHALGIAQTHNQHFERAIVGMKKERGKRRRLEKAINTDFAAIDSGNDAGLDGMLLGEDETADPDKNGITISTAGLEA
jgi:hypothetical protein